MKFVSHAFLGASVLTLTSCGGGGSSAPPPTSGPTPAPPATLNASLPVGSIDINLDERDSNLQFSFDVDISGTTTEPVVADVEIGGKRYELETVAGSGSRYQVFLITVTSPAGGATSTDVRFRLCRTSACSTVYPGSTVSFTVNLDVELEDWKTFQRNERHDGYVRVAYDPDDFAEAWSVPTGTIRPTQVAATEGLVFYNIQDNGRYLSRAIDSSTGDQAWQVDLGIGQSYLGAPSYNDGRVVSASMDTSSFTLPMQILDAQSGNVEGTISYASQFATPPAPVPFGNQLFLQSGYFGNVVFAWNVESATAQWEVEPNGPGGMGFIMEGQSVAVDEDYVYYYGVSNLYLLDRETGATITTIPDPFFNMGGLSYFGTYYASPILDNSGDVFAFSGNRGRNQALPIHKYDIRNDGTGDFTWRSANTYQGQPALRDSRLYAIQANSTRIDTIDTPSNIITAITDVIPAGTAPLNSNVIVTNRHLFVANDTETFAIDISNFESPFLTWFAPRGGDLAITPDNLLIISGPEGIFAYSLFDPNP